MNTMQEERHLQSLIKKLENYRLEHKIPQKKLAKLLDVSLNTVNNWMTDKTLPNQIQAYAVEKFLIHKGG
jgi:DNA-binding XRE family transcriptional regulator